MEPSAYYFLQKYFKLILRMTLPIFLLFHKCSWDLYESGGYHLKNIWSMALYWPYIARHCSWNMCCLDSRDHKVHLKNFYPLNLLYLCSFFFIFLFRFHLLIKVVVLFFLFLILRFQQEWTEINIYTEYQLKFWFHKAKFHLPLTVIIE